MHAEAYLCYFAYPMDRKLYISIFLTIMSTALGASLVVPLLPLYAQDMGATGLQLGLIFAAFALARSIFLPVVGQLADTWGRRAFMLWGLFIYVSISVAFDKAASVNQLVVCRLIQGAGAAMVIPVARAYVGEMAPDGQEGRLMGHFNMAFFGGLALGPWMGGFLKDHFGISYSFYSMGLLALFGLVLCWFNLPRTGKAVGPLRSNSVSLLSLMRSPTLLAMFIFRFGSIMGVGINWTFLPLFGHDALKLSSSRIGILISLTVVMTTLLQPTFGRMADRVSRKWMTFFGGAAASACMFVVPFCDHFYQLFILNATMGVALGAYMPPLMAMAVDAGRGEGGMTKVMSLLEMAFSFGMVLGPLVAGLVQQTLGLTYIFWVGGGLGLTSCFVFTAIYKGR